MRIRSKRRLLLTTIVTSILALACTALALTFTGILAKIKMEILAPNCTFSPINKSVISSSGQVVKLRLISNVTVKNVGKLGLVMYLKPEPLPQGIVLAVSNITVVNSYGKVIWTGCIVENTKTYTVYTGQECSILLTYSEGRVTITVKRISLTGKWKYPIIVHEGKYTIVMNTVLITGYSKAEESITYKIDTILETPQIITRIQ